MVAVAPLRPGLVDRQRFLRDVLAGLERQPRMLPCKYFYDQRGSQLFDLICQTPEYYPTRKEIQILADHAENIAGVLGSGVVLVEYGSGTSAKTRVLLDHLRPPLKYVPVDISAEHLFASAHQLRQSYPALDVFPLAADFTRSISRRALPGRSGRVIVFFSGSTLGNFDPARARRLLQDIARLCAPDGGLLVGIDLKKNVGVLTEAYNDRAGVTAAFNKNLLQRINAELGGNFDLRQFQHRAVYEPGPGRICMSLVSQSEQTVVIDDRCFDFAESEPIVTEHSYKFDVDGFCSLAAAAGLEARHIWTDSRQWFAVIYCEVVRESVDDSQPTGRYRE
jgi:dimethylhistidine N-methyltransferase